MTGQDARPTSTPQVWRLLRCARNDRSGVSLRGVKRRSNLHRLFEMKESYTAMNIIHEIKEEIRAAQREPSNRDLTILALLFLIIPGLIGLYLVFWKGSESGYIWMIVGAVLAVSRLIRPLFKTIYSLWLGFSVILGYFISRALLTIIFFLVLTPTGLIMRLVGKDPMERKWDPEAKSYWIKREEDPRARIWNDMKSNSDII